MRNLLFILLLALPTSLFASGKLNVKSVEDSKTNKVKYNVGLAVYERLCKSVAYVGWLGVGEKVSGEADAWAKTEQGLEFYMGPFSVGGGAQYKYLPKPDKDELSYYGTVGLALWK